MFDNVKWDVIINKTIQYIKKWSYLIIKLDISKTGYSAKYYYSENGIDYIDLYTIIDSEKSFELLDFITPELEKVTKKFDDYKEKMFVTVKVEKNGNVKVIYKDIKEGNKLPFDESNKHLILSEEDKIK